MKSISCLAVLLASLIYSVYVNASIIVYDTWIDAEVSVKNYKNEIWSAAYQGDGDANIGITDYNSLTGGAGTIRTGKHAEYFSYPHSIFDASITLDNDNIHFNGSHTASLSASLTATSMFRVTDSNAKISIQYSPYSYNYFGSIFIQDLTANQSVYAEAGKEGFLKEIELLVNHSYELQAIYSVPLSQDIGDGNSFFQVHARGTDVQIPEPSSLSIMFITLIGLFFTNRRRFF